MSAVNRLRSDLDRLPRALKVGIAVVVAVILFIVINDKVWSYADKWNAEADQLETVIAESAARAKDPDKQTKDLVAAFGPVETPTDESTGSQSMARAVNEVIESRGKDVTNFSYVATAASKLPREALTKVADHAGQRFDRLRAEVRFDTSTELAAQIMAELESRPEVESIVSVRVVRHDIAPKVSVTMTIETWVRSSTGDRRRGGPV